jgi:hypothetical protein
VARKHCEPSQEPGPWAGVVAHSQPKEPIYKLVTQTHWDQTKWFLKEVHDLHTGGLECAGTMGDPMEMDWATLEST